MKRSSVFRAGSLIAGAVLSAAPAPAQVSLGADLGLFSSYAWRGVSLTNRPVAQPDLYVTVPAGKGSLTFGGWGSIDLGKYDGGDEISESGGISSFNFAELDPWAEFSYPVGKATLGAGVLGYIFPNDLGLTSSANTLELYGKVALDLPLKPKLAAYYDVVNIKGLYAEGSISHTIQASEKLGIALGALAGVNAGEGVPTNSDESFSYNDDGFTHLDLSAAVPFTAGALNFSPALHVVIAGDELVKVTSPTTSSDVKLWGGMTISWSRALTPSGVEESSQ
jgi:hypothetical protein